MTTIDLFVETVEAFTLVLRECEALRAQCQELTPKALRLARKRDLRLTQAEMGDLLEIAPSTISKLEGGALQPSDELVLKLAAVIRQSG